MDLFFSNKLEILAQELKSSLFSSSSPFTKRWVIVPHYSVKDYLFSAWAQDKDLQIAAGVKVITFPQAVKMFFPQVPSQLELSFRIENVLQNTEESELKRYLKEASTKKIGSFCDELSSVFLNNMFCYELEVWEKKQGWQQRLWKTLFKEPQQLKALADVEGEIYLFHLSTLSSFHFSFFEKRAKRGFFLSPCQMFWTDFSSKYAQAGLLKKSKGLQKEEWKSYFQEQNRFLSNCGKVGRDFLKRVEVLSLISEERYEEPKKKTFLESMQYDVLTLEKSEKEVDTSIQIHSAPSRLREVEVVFEILQKIISEKGEVHIYAPNIGDYFPYIQMVFERKENRYDFAIFDLPFLKRSGLASALLHLLKIPSTDFDVEAVLKLLSFSSFLKRFQLKKEDVQLLDKWTKKAGIRFGREEKEGSWERGFTYLLDALTMNLGEDFLNIPLFYADLLGQWIEILSALKKMKEVFEQKKSVSEWMAFLYTVCYQFFAIEEDDELILKEFEKLKICTEGVFSFSSIERSIVSILEGKGASFHKNVLHAVKFFSLEEGCATPCESIILMGQEETSFPRVERKNSLWEMENSSICSQVDKDRYLFFEHFLCARKHFIVTYTRLDPEDRKEIGPSHLLEELEVPIYHHPTLSFDRSYFQESGFRTSSRIQYLLAQKFYTEKKKAKRVLFEIPSQRGEREPSPILINTAYLRSLAHHPIKAYFEKKHGMYFEKEEKKHPEFILSYLDLAKYRRSFLKEEIGMILKKAEQKGELPLGPLKKVAIQIIEKEFYDYSHVLKELNIEKNTVFSVELKKGCLQAIQIQEREWRLPPFKTVLKNGQEIELVGRLDSLSSEGILFHGKNKIEDIVKIASLCALLHTLPLSIKSQIIFTKEGEIRQFPISPEVFLSLYLEYALWAQKSPSPLLPSLAKFLITEDLEGFEAALIKEDRLGFSDPVLEWIKRQNGFPETKFWSPRIREMFYAFL